MREKEIAFMALPVVSIRPNPKGLAFGRYVIAKMASVDNSDAISFAENWRDMPQIAACLRSEINFVGVDYLHKAVVNPGTVAEPAWAAPLAVHGINRDVIELERGGSVVGNPALASKFRRVPFRSTTTREIGAGTGSAWVGEGAPTPVVSNIFDSVSQEMYKLAVLVVLSRELERLGDPGALKVTSTTVNGVVRFLDQQFLDPAVTLISGVRPASVTNGATAITTTGGTAAQIIADLTAMIQAITTSATTLVWVMQAQTFYTITSRLAGTGLVVGGTLFGIPVVLSANSPKQITLIDAGEILFSDDGDVEVEISRQASVEMADVPTSPPTASTITISLWQQNLLSVRVHRWIAWQRGRSGSVAYMVSTY